LIRILKGKKGTAQKKMGMVSWRDRDAELQKAHLEAAKPEKPPQKEPLVSAEEGKKKRGGGRSRSFGQQEVNQRK